VRVVRSGHGGFELWSKRTATATSGLANIFGLDGCRGRDFDACLPGDARFAAWSGYAANDPVNESLARQESAMRRPARTRLLSIAAAVSLLAFVVVAASGIRSLWVFDAIGRSNQHGGWAIELADARATFELVLSSGASGPIGRGHVSARLRPNSSIVGRAIWGFHAEKTVLPSMQLIQIITPLWLPLLLLLIAPVCWLIARQAKPPAFPVVESKQE